MDLLFGYQADSVISGVEFLLPTGMCDVVMWSGAYGWLRYG